jgi:hypothetical protein
MHACSVPEGYFLVPRERNGISCWANNGRGAINPCIVAMRDKDKSCPSRRRECVCCKCSPQPSPVSRYMEILLNQEPLLLLLEEDGIYIFIVPSERASTCIVLCVTTEDRQTDQRMDGPRFESLYLLCAWCEQ